MLKLVKIFTDGSCLGNPGAGGYGTILRYKKTEKILTSGFFLTTNNRMELMGVISGLEFLKQSCTVEIFTDSRYVQNGVTKWMNKWKQQKWEKNNKKLIKNIDLWLRINDLLKKHCITWFWIKGHSGHIENELCDKIARQSANHPCIQDKFYEIVFYKKLQEKIMILTNIIALKDNYIWILYDKNNSCIIVDPGVSNIVIKEIIKKKWNPKAILLTHNHIDHTGGVENILKKYPKIIVFGPEETKNSHVHQIIKGGDKIRLLENNIDIIFTPGHTLGHVAYYLKPYLFCGDTLFSAGCGKVFENNYAKMYNSIQLIKLFPNNTVLCCSHEYTLSNLIFSMHFLPKDKNIKDYYKKIHKKIFLKKNIFPFLLNKEKKINIFLRTNEFFLKKSMGFKKDKDSFEVFCYLRKIKDIFGAKRD